MKDQTAASTFEHNAIEVIKLIPSGRVATYGQIAQLAGFRNYARHVGRVLARVPNHLNLPWHRVINAQGAISHRGMPGGIEQQRLLLEDEGVEFGLYGKIDLARFQWLPDTHVK